MTKTNQGKGAPQDAQPNQGGELALDKQPNQGGELALDKQPDQGGEFALDKQPDQGGEFALDKQPDQGGELVLDASTNQDLQTETVKTKKVRVLSDCAHGKANDVVELLVDEIKSAKESGFVDDHPDAVAYAESLLNQ